MDPGAALGAPGLQRARESTDLPPRPDAEASAALPEQTAALKQSDLPK
jgi:hypothetical protein